MCLAWPIEHYFTPIDPTLFIARHRARRPYQQRTQSLAFQHTRTRTADSARTELDELRKRRDGSDAHQIGEQLDAAKRRHDADVRRLEVNNLIDLILTH